MPRLHIGRGSNEGSASRAPVLNLCARNEAGGRTSAAALSRLRGGPADPAACAQASMSSRQCVRAYSRLCIRFAHPRASGESNRPLRCASERRKGRGKGAPDGPVHLHRGEAVEPPVHAARAARVRVNPRSCSNHVQAHACANARASLRLVRALERARARARVSSRACADACMCVCDYPHCQPLRSLRVDYTKGNSA